MQTILEVLFYEVRISMFRLKIIGALLIALGSAPLVAAAGESITPAWSSQLTSLVRRPDAEIPSVTLVYEVSWSKWVQAGEIQIDFDPQTEQQNALIKATAKAQSKGAVRALWPYESWTQAELSSTTLYPYRFDHVQTERGEKEEYHAIYRNGEMTVESLRTLKHGEGVERETQTHTLEQIRDILSTLLYLQQTELNDHANMTLLVQPLDHLYLASFTVVGGETRTVLDKTWDTIKLTIEIQSVTDDFKLAPYAKMRHATIWLSDDDARIPVEIQADLLIGFVSVRLAGSS